MNLLEIKIQNSYTFQFGEPFETTATQLQTLVHYARNNQATGDLINRNTPSHAREHSNIKQKCTFTYTKHVSEKQKTNTSSTITQNSDQHQLEQQGAVEGIWTFQLNKEQVV